MGLLSKAQVSSSGLENKESHSGLLYIINNRKKKAGKTVSNKIPVKTPLRQTVKETVSSPEKTLMERLSTEHSKYNHFQGLIIEVLKYPSGEFSGHLASMVSGFGAVQRLSAERCLVLFDSAKDGELIGNHLAKAIPGKIIFCFQAENPQKAFSLLKPYL